MQQQRRLGWIPFWIFCLICLFIDIGVGIEKMQSIGFFGYILLMFGGIPVAAFLLFIVFGVLFGRSVRR